MTEKQTRVAIVAVVLVVLLAAAKLYRDAHRYSYPRPGERVDNYTGQVCRLNPRAGWVDAVNIRRWNDTILFAPVTDSVDWPREVRNRRSVFPREQAFTRMPESFDPSWVDTIIIRNSERMPCAEGGRDAND